MSIDILLNDVSVAADGAGNKILLRDVNACFEAGRITLLIGRNGAGKSTLLEAMAGVRTLQSGTIELAGESLWTPKSRGRKVNRNVSLQLGIAMQHSESQWFAATVRRELEYSLKPYAVGAEEAEQRIASALLKVGLEHELLERDPWTLSGGQQRRLSLACLLACEPDWLLLDEPTAGLDADGVRRLCAVLAAHRAAGRGAVVATHDLDALLPLADAVAVVSGGTVREAAPAAAAEHAAVAPQALRVQALLRAAGAAVPPDASAGNGGGALWPAPQELAAALSAQLTSSKRERLAEKPVELAAQSEKGQEQGRFTASGKPHLSNVRANESFGIQDKEMARRLRSDRFDPRALMISYLLLTAGVLIQSNLWQLLLSAIIVVPLIIPFWTLIQPWLRVIRGFAILTVILCLIGGLSFSPFVFQWEKSAPTVVRLGELMIIMVLGMPLFKLVTPLRLQRSIEQTFGWMNRLHLPIYSFGLLITLIFRFIPLLMGEWVRFAKLAHARGKATSPPGAIPIKMLRSIMIPYIRSILRLAEQMADALEARGYGNTKRKPSFGLRLKFGAPDAVVIGIASCGAALLFLISKV